MVMSVKISWTISMQTFEEFVESSSGIGHKLQNSSLIIPRVETCHINFARPNP
jgi:hypothetical protein